MVASGGRCRRRSITQRSTCSESAATQTASSARNMTGLIHVAVGGSGGVLRIAAVLTCAQIGRIPVPPVVFGVRLLVVVVGKPRLVEELCNDCDVRGLCTGRLPIAAGKP